MRDLEQWLITRATDKGAAFSQFRPTNTYTQYIKYSLITTSFITNCIELIVAQFIL